MHYFYSQIIKNNVIELSKDEAHHASRVMRLNIGDVVGVFNGVGELFSCRIKELTKSKCLLNVEGVVKSKSFRSGLSILIAPTKSNDRFEWFLEKACEIGIGEIVPILTERSERKKIRIDRFEKVLISAMKQSMNPFLPIVSPLTSFKDAIDKYADCDRFISHCMDDDRKDFINVIDSNKTAILIGPEGDFSVNELNLAKKAGWKGVSLGKQRFRTETAGIIAAHIHSLKISNLTN
jgi:16S rRNA (uracil1498-N3)-methyltransferase